MLEMKNINKMKNAFDELISRLDTAEENLWAWEYDNIIIELKTSKIEKRLKKAEQNT